MKPGRSRPGQLVLPLLSAVPIVLGAVVLLGWYLDLIPLIRLSSSLPAMQAATAVAFLFSGLALLTAIRGHSGAALVFGGGVALIGALTVASFVVGLPPVLNDILAVPPVGGGQIQARHMAPKSGLAFLLAGTAIVLLAFHRARSPVPPVLGLVGATGVLLLAGEDLAKYMAEWAGASDRTLKQMALHTALAFLALSAALIIAARERLHALEARGWRGAWLSAAVVMLLAGLAAHFVRVNQVEAVRRTSRLAAVETALQVSGTLRDRDRAVSALATRLSSGPTDSAEWTAFATALTTHLGGISRIAWIDGSGAARWRAPANAAGPWEGPVLQSPVTIRGRVAGRVSALLDVDALLSGDASDRAHAMEVRIGEHVYRRGRMDETVDALFVEYMPLTLPGDLQGEIVVQPTRGLLDAGRRPIPLAALMLGALFAGLLAVAVQAAHTARHRAATLTETLASLAQEVTERRRAEEALARSEARLRESQKMEAVARLAGGIAHHFNNLLSVVRGYSDLLLMPAREGDKDEDEREFAEEIHRAATRGAELTRSLLTMSARHVLHPRTLELRTLLQDQARSLGRLLGDRIELRIRGETADTRVLIDPGPFANALTTLATNARVAMPDGGRFTLVLRERSLTPADASLHGIRAGSYVELEVADTGTGMDQATRDVLFEPFTAAPRGDQHGGFGLAMMYGFVRQSGGMVEVDSAPGWGTVFRIALPRAEGRAPARTTVPARTNGRDARVILLAEDEDAVRRLASRILERAGFEVIAATDGAAALAQIEGREDRIDLLLTDVVMPGVGGAELATRIRESRPDLPVLFMSGYTADAVPSAMFEADAATAFLQKPFEAVALVSRSRELLRTEAGAPV